MLGITETAQNSTGQFIRAASCGVPVFEKLAISTQVMLLLIGAGVGRAAVDLAPPRFHQQALTRTPPPQCIEVS